MVNYARLVQNHDLTHLNLRNTKQISPRPRVETNILLPVQESTVGGLEYINSIYTHVHIRIKGAPVNSWLQQHTL
jgi:hypothetical protein